MSNFSLVRFSVDRPRTVLLATLLVTAAFATPFRHLTTDTNPKNMLPETSAVRVWNAEVERTFGLYEDVVVVGVVNERGILAPDTLDRLARLTAAVRRLDGVAERDVTSFTTVTNVAEKGGTLEVGPLMAAVPRTAEELAALRAAVFGNPLLLDRMISRDGTTTAIYVPLETGANGKAVADEIRALVGHESGPEHYYVAGDPVARDTFGAEMFRLMAYFSPVAGLIMILAVYLMFRSFYLALSMMGVAMVSIVWSMGLVVALGYPIHIMSSMSPVFLMAIATDSIHIFNELSFRFREHGDKRQAILATMDAVAGPVRYTALATAVGFGVLLFMQIIPVRVFGGLVAFGTVVLRLLSFSLVPALLTFVREERLARATEREHGEQGRAARALRGLARLGADHPVATLAVGGALLVAALAGTSRIVVNNNMVSWFKEGSEVRTADRVMNEALGGTSLAYVVASGSADDAIKSPEALRAIEALQDRLEALPVVGKTLSVADYVKRIHLVLHGDQAEFDAVPGDRDTIGQYLFLFAMSARPSDLDSVVEPSFRRANIWVQLETWDAGAMRQVIGVLDDFAQSDAAGLTFEPAGVAYFNLVWNDEVLWDMVKGFALALVAVFGVLALDFRSLRWALVGYLPLILTVVIIYGVLGFAGKDFDMPISVLSCLSLGMAVDFAIHFVSRFQRQLPEGRALDAATVRETLLWTAGRPGKGIVRNALLFAAAFSVMLFAPLTPYVTVGAFIVAMMLLSALLTLVVQPALITLLWRWLPMRRGTREGGGENLASSGGIDQGHSKGRTT